MAFSGIEAFRQTDTSPEATRLYVEALRRAGPGRRLRRALELSELTRRLCFDDLRRRHPELPEDQLRTMFIERVYGTEHAKRFREHLARSSR